MPCKPLPIPVPSDVVPGVEAYPEVNLQVSAPSEFPVADLERDCHLVVLVQLLVEAFALVRLHLDVVRRCEGEQAARRCE